MPSKAKEKEMRQEKRKKREGEKAFFFAFYGCPNFAS